MGDDTAAPEHEQPAASDGSTSLSTEIRHDWIKIMVAALLVVVMWNWLVAPGWDSSHRDPVLPVLSADLVALGFAAFPSTGSVRLSLDAKPLGQSSVASIGLDVTMDGDQPSDSPSLLVSGEIARTIQCTGAGVSYQRGVGFEKLSSASKAAALSHAEKELRSAADTASGGWVQPGDAEVMSEAARLTYTEVTIDPDVTEEPGTYIDPKTKKNVPYTRRTRRVDSECMIDSASIWSKTAPDYQLRLPAFFVMMPKSSTGDNELSVEATVPAMSGLSLTQATYSSTTGSQGQVTWSQSGTTQRNPFAEDTVNNYHAYSRGSIGAVFRSAVEAQQEQAKVFNSGIGLGVAASLVVWMWPVVYDLLFIKHPMRRRLTGPSTPKQGQNEPTE